MDAQLESGDPAQLASAVGLDEEQLTAEIITGFGTSDLTFNIREALPLAGAWDIPVTMTTVNGDTTEWIATVVDSGDGLVLADTRAAE